MRHVIIPDVHQQITTLVSIVDKWSTEDTHFVLLGDYFDSFRQSESAVEEMCQWLNTAAQQPEKFTLLYGNHDVHYLLPGGPSRYRCSGYSSLTQSIIDSRLSDATRAQFKFHAWIGEDILCSHAGLTFPWLVQAFRRRDCLTNPPTPTEIRNFLNHQERMFFGMDGDSRAYAVQPHDVFLQVGRARGGYPTALGGMTWCDWYQEFEPIPNLRQIVGHTVVDSHPAGETYVPDEHHGNWNLDTNLRYVGLVTEGVIQPKPALLVTN